jgi:hypothetical protein
VKEDVMPIPVFIAAIGAFLASQPGAKLLNHLAIHGVLAGKNKFEEHEYSKVSVATNGFRQCPACSTTVSGDSEYARVQGFKRHSC